MVIEIVYKKLIKTHKKNNKQPIKTHKNIKDSTRSK